VQLPQLKRIRWAVRAALILGVAASVTANVLHARQNPISQAISAWPPLALLLTVELTSRVPMHKRVLAALRVLATIAIAGIAAWVSYWHMQGVALNYGETEMSSFLLPISVDGLIVVASVSLVELAGRIRTIEEQRQRIADAAAVAPVQFVQPAPVAPPAPVFQAPQPQTPRYAQPEYPQPEHAQPEYAQPEYAQGGDMEYDRSPLSHEAIREAPVSPAVAPVARPLAHGLPVAPAVAATSRPAPLYSNGSQPPARPAARTGIARPAVSTSRTIVTSPTTKPAESATPRQRRPVAETAKLADEIEAMEPRISETELAKRLGISADRLRVIRREAGRVGSTHS
jgi:Protein of unknown function (DUF2637)